jgi:TonB family protein
VTALLAGAVFASVAVHAALVMIPVGSGSMRSSAGGPSAIPARLLVTETLAPALPIQSVVPTPVMPMTAPLMPRRLAPVNTIVEAPASDPLAHADIGISASRAAIATPLVAYARLGDLQARWQSEFPAEVEMPVRIHGEIKVPYPAAALEQRIEGNVVVWAIVNPDGTVEDVQLVEGDAVFRDAIVAALRDGRYQPAANRGESLSYPIALEFSFSLADDRQGAPVASSR